MKTNVYTLFDSAATAFTTPFFMHNDGLAIRAFQDNVNGQESNISLHPEQFTLMKIGTWDDKSATIQPLETPVTVAIGVELINDNKPRYSNTDLQKIQDELDTIKAYIRGKNND